MSEKTQTLDPKEQNRMRFIRTNRKQDHGTRDMDTFEHVMRKEDREAASRSRAFIERKFGHDAIRAAASPAELEDHADQLLLEAGDTEPALRDDNETFHIPVYLPEDSEEKVNVSHPRSSASTHLNENTLGLEMSSRRRAYEDVERVYNGDNGDDEKEDYFDGFSVKTRP